MTDWTLYRSFTRSLLRPLNLQAAMYALINQLTLVCNMQWNVLDDLAEDHEGVGRIKKDSLIRFVQFRRHVRLTPIVSKTILVILSFFVLWLRPLFCLVRCFLCWRNANLAGIFACRRCVASFLFVSSSPWICLVV